MVLTIVICYIVCWTPYWCYQVFNYFYQHVFKNQQIILFVVISHFIQVIAYMSSALNPFIYSYMSEAFRSSFQLVLNNCHGCIFGVNKEAVYGHELTPLNNQIALDDEVSKQSIADSNYENSR